MIRHLRLRQRDPHTGREALPGFELRANHSFDEVATAKGNKTGLEPNVDGLFIRPHCFKGGTLREGCHLYF